MKCKLCKSESLPLLKAKVLEKYDVQYFRCPNCEFIQTEKPYWLKEAYDTAIANLDIGLVDRNQIHSRLVTQIIDKYFKSQSRFLDFAGGYGLFVRLMRDRGFNFYRQDKFCENIFAQNYDLQDLPENPQFELVTAFEVFEHLENPIEDIKKIFQYSPNIIFSTDLAPKNIKKVEDWWYFVPETGQHIAFYTERTLNYIAKKLKVKLYTDGRYHLFTNQKLGENPFKLIGEEPAREKSLLELDFKAARASLKKNKQPFTKRVASKTLEEKLFFATSRSEMLEGELLQKTSDLEKVNRAAEFLEGELEATKARVDAMTLSEAWKMGKRLSKVGSMILPKATLRRRVFDRSLALARRAARATRRALVAFKCLIDYLDGLIVPHKKRNINKKSKKIAYIGHSYHVKTQSTAFLIDYLKQFYEVEVIADESWRGEGEPYPDLSHIDESYLAVIFFQNLPADLSLLEKVENENLIFFPMFDATSTWTFNIWRKLRRLKIMNFSSTLHKKLKSWGFQSEVVQYFPKPQEFSAGKMDEAFFWQRLTKFNINMVEKLLGDQKIKIHLHTAIDPAQEYIKPTKAQDKKYQITYSDWFERREEMWELIKSKAIYIAPREFEGIGMSFLEAMAMGKVVIAVDNPTMNEYIKDGETGYLFDLKNPKEISLESTGDVQKKTFEYMKKGYEKWEKEKKKIIDFIESE